MVRPVRAIRAARRARAHARASGTVVRGCPMSAHGLLTGLALASVIALAGCNDAREPTFQGWVEAELIFVGPDDSGRIETLSVREGDQVEKVALLLTLDPDLQRADGDMQE